MIPPSASIPTKRRFSCPLTNTIMEDPVIAPCCGANFERRALHKWMAENGNHCPHSGDPLLFSDVKANTSLHWEILYLERTSSSNADIDGSCCCGSYTSERRASLSSSSRHADLPPILPRSSPEVRSTTRKTINTKRDAFCRTPLASNERGPPQGESPLSSPRTKNPSTPFLKQQSIDLAPTAPKRLDFGSSFAPTSLSIHEILFRSSEEHPVVSSSSSSTSTTTSHKDTDKEEGEKFLPTETRIVATDREEGGSILKHDLLSTLTEVLVALAEEN